MKIIFVLFPLLALCYCRRSPEEGDAFEGDMMLNPNQIAAINEQRSGQNQYALVKSRHWKTNGKTDVITYYIDPVISGAEKVIKEAIADYEGKTCLRFKRATSKPSGPHFFFTTGSGCFSPVGKSSRGNRIQLARGCWRKGIVIHEMGHSLGFYHEQSRPDRDNYVTINYNNVEKRWAYAFDKYNSDRIDSLGSPYDYDSVMHYGSYYFSINSKITIETKDSKDQGRIGQRKGFSTEDLKQINKLYCSGNSGGGTKPACEDKNNRCKDWKKYCGNNNYVDQNCKKTCNSC